MAKQTYRIRNWSDDNKSLVSRGSLTVWFDEKTIKHGYASPGKGKRGRPKRYAGIAISCALTLRAVFICL